MAESTITDMAAAAALPTARTFTRLIVLADADAPAAGSSLHVLDDLDVVRFQRGPRAAQRTLEDGARVLALRLADGRMSSAHGVLRREPPRWVLDDPSSKNGAMVDGVATRRAVLDDGSLIQLGHTFFLFRQSVVDELPAHLAGDVAAAALPPWPRGMATFAPDLARELAALVRIAPRPTAVLVRGETGTGKELIARAVHALSGRTGPFVAVNCAALPPTLLESELFGHRRGAFSGAVADRRGLVRSADGGTLFLDEIGELPPASQGALLRVLQEREVMPLGEDRAVPVDVRVVAATLRDLDADVAAERFRPDLYARVAAHVVALPPLRARREDTGLLVAGMVPAAARFTPAALRRIIEHDWPLNIRALEQALARAWDLADGGVIDVAQLPAAVRAARADPPAPAPDAALELDTADRELRERLIALFAQHEGNVVAVAEAFGKQRAQIYKWVKRLEIDLAVFRRR